MGAPNPDVTALVTQLALQHWTVANTPDLTAVIAAVNQQLSRLGGEVNPPLVAFANAQLDALFAAQEANESSHGGVFHGVVSDTSVSFQGQIAAIVGFGTVPNGAGIIGIGGAPGGRALQGNGGNVSGLALRAIGGLVSGVGAQITGGGTGDGCTCNSTGSGTGVTGVSVTGYGAAFTGNATRAPLRMVPLAAAPSSPQTGDMYYDSGTNHFFGWTGAAWIQLDN
jgi:hypothetical protein